MTDPTTLSSGKPRKRRSTGLRLLLHGYRFALIVAIVVLVRWKAASEDLTRQGPVKMPLAEVQTILSRATTLQGAADREGAYVEDTDGNRIGWAVTTLPTCRKITGFSGPTNTLVVCDTDNQIRGIAILSSQDTPEHLAAVRKEPWFTAQFVGKSPADLAAGGTVDAVSGATLTSLAIIESVTKIVGSDPPNYRFPAEITVEEVAQIKPAAKRLMPRSSPRGWWDIFDATGQQIGTAWRTSPAADHHVGYQGPTDVLVVMDSDEVVKAVALRESYDNDPYVRYVREDWSFPEYLTGYDLERLAALDVYEDGIEGVSGATMTSQAATQAVGIAAAHVREQQMRPDSPQAAPAWPTLTWRDAATLGVVVTAVVIAFTNLRGKRWVQIGFGLLVIGYLGFYAAEILSMALLVGWARHPIPWEKCLGLVAVATAALAVPLFSKKQVYCNHICPHGAAQMMILRVSKWHWTVPSKLRPVLAAIPAILLAIVILAAFSLLDANLAAIEPFDAYVPSIAGWASISIAVGGLIFSAFVPMGYCRYGCPTGAILSHVRWNAASDRWTLRDSTATLLLGLAVVCFWL